MRPQTFSVDQHFTGKDAEVKAIYDRLESATQVDREVAGWVAQAYSLSS